MTWTASIIGKQLNVGYVEVAVRYTDGTDIKDELVRVTDGNIDTLRRVIGNRIAALTAAQSLGDSLALGSFDPTVTPPTPDPADVAFGIWNRKFTRLQSVQILIDLGIFTGSEAPIVALRSDVQSTFQASFLSRL